MQWIIARIKWIMLVSGALTCTMLYAAIAPQAALRTTFGPVLEGPVAEIVVRNWGALIALVGALLIYGAFNPPSRRLILTIATISKVMFMLLVITYGRQYLGKAGIALVVDLISVGLFGAYLLGVRQQPAAGSVAGGR
jgi:hypothetical protein